MKKSLNIVFVYRKDTIEIGQDTIEEFNYTNSESKLIMLLNC